MAKRKWTLPVRIYTDGACKGNPGPGGWAFLAQRLDESGEVQSEKLVSGGDRETTNNRMELTAVLRAVEFLNDTGWAFQDVTILTDSQNVIGWLSQGWKRRNPDVARLCLAIEKAIAESGHQVRFEKVPAHSGVPENERVDSAASSEAVVRGG